MAATLYTTLDVHCSIPHTSDTNRPIRFTCNLRLATPTNRRFTVVSKSSKSPPRDLEQPQKQNPSLSDQLKPLSAATLSDQPPAETHLLAKPKSIWVNPTKPKPSVLTLQRHKRSSYSPNPQIRDLKLLAKKLNDSDLTDSGFISVLEKIPTPPTKENSLLLLNSLKPWPRTLLFFNWIKTHNLFPMETIFYNVTMKSLRHGKQFHHVEELALEMIQKDIVLDNITYSTIITCAKRCKLFDKAVEWFERMYKTGLMPDEVTYSAILDVFAKLGKVEEVLSLYERGRASGWKPDPIAFSVLCKMFGETGDYDGIKYVLQEMKSSDLKPGLVVYNSLLEALGKANKPGLAKSLFEEMIESGVSPNAKTLTALTKIYGKARWAIDALELWARIKSNHWPSDFILYNTLLSMCADLALEQEAEELFADMKSSENCRPDSWSYTAMLNIYGSGGNVEKAMSIFDEMSRKGVDINVMGCTCLIQCLGRGKKIDELVRVFETSIQKGVKPDDRLCGCLLSVLSYCESENDADKVMNCLSKCNPELVGFIEKLGDPNNGFDVIKFEFKAILSEAQVEVRRPFCNCLIDICRNRDLHGRAHELLYLGTVFGLYPGLHTKMADEWRMNVRSLSVGAAETALEEWMETLTKMVGKKEALPEVFSAATGAGTHKFSQGLGNAFASHVEKLAAPFRQSEEKPGLFVATREDIATWVAQGIPIVEYENKKEVKEAIMKHRTKIVTTFLNDEEESWAIERFEASVKNEKGASDVR